MRRQTSNVKRGLMVRALLLVGLLLTAACTRTPPDAAAPETAARFTGEVTRGAAFEREIGAGLRFRLDYAGREGEDWSIWVGSADQPDDDFSRYVTLPLRGLNDRYIAGWHFRNAENTGPRAEDDPPVPHTVRHFAFVLNEADYQTAGEAVAVLMWPHQHTEAEVAQAFEVYEALPVATGVLTITHLELGNLVAGETAWIERMMFEVDIQWP